MSTQAKVHTCCRNGRDAYVKRQWYPNCSIRLRPSHMLSMRTRNVAKAAGACVTVMFL